MGWQGRWRDSKGRHFFQDLPLADRIGCEFIAAYSWRSNNHVWIKVRRLGETVGLRFNRLTCKPEPLEGAENFFRQGGWGMQTEEFRILRLTCDNLRRELTKARHDLTSEQQRRERLDVQLAGCLTAAEGGTSSAVVAKPEDWGWSPAYQRVLDLRRNWDSLTHEVEEAWKILGPNPANPERWRSLADACEAWKARAEAAEHVFDVQVTVLPRKPIQPLAPAVSEAVDTFYRECTPGELKWLNKGMCPDCHSANFLAGPQCTNVKCGFTGCGSRFNIRLPYFAQRIFRPKPNLGL